jgi:hypothetical protein
VLAPAGTNCGLTRLLLSSRQGTLLSRALALYRVMFGQPRQQDLLSHLSNRINADEVQQKVGEWRISLEPPESLPET